MQHSGVQSMCLRVTKYLNLNVIIMLFLNTISIEHVSKLFSKTNLIIIDIVHANSTKLIFITYYVHGTIIYSIII